jgi:hypothetical protein
MSDRKKRVPLNPNVIASKYEHPEDWAYWKEKLGVSGKRIASAIRVVGSRSAKDVARYLREEEDYRKALQIAPLTGRKALPPSAVRANRARKAQERAAALALARRRSSQ